MKRKKIVCLLLSGLLTMGLVSGCGSSSSDEGGDAKNETKTEDTKKDDAAKRKLPETRSLFVWRGGDHRQDMMRQTK